MIVETIKKFLDAEDKKFDPVAASWAVDRFKDLIVRRFMEKDRRKPEWMYATLVTKECVRQSFYKHWEFPEDEKLATRARMNFWMGDLVEMGMLCLAKMAGVNLLTPFERLPHTRMSVSRGPLRVSCWPDGIVEAGGTVLNVEIKKMNEYAFDELNRTGYLDDKWGYRTQCQLEVATWREQGVPAKQTLFLALKGLTGHFGEWVIPYEPALVDKALDRGDRVLASVKDRIPERAYKPVETKDQRLKLGTQCAYCSHKKTCWGELIKEFDGDRPIWYLPGAADAIRMLEMQLPF